MQRSGGGLKQAKSEMDEQQRQKSLLERQDAEKAAERKKLNKQQIDMLRRTRGVGAVAGTINGPQTTTSLYNDITGKQ